MPNQHGEKKSQYIQINKSGVSNSRISSKKKAQLRRDIEEINVEMTKERKIIKKASATAKMIM